MNSKKSIAQLLEELAGSRRVRAFAIAALVLAALAVLQAENLKRNTPMCELLGNCNLGNGDLQRMQIALSQASMGEYVLKDNQLLVPTAKHADYLQALAEQNAIPEELRDADEKRPTVNPFLSRSQQISIEKAEKKHQVREMVLRLPFVEQAWFEMDKSDSHSAFEQPEHSAVVSIRTPPNVSLSDQHVDTVKRMIGGAVAALRSDNIVVIDLSGGFAHQQHIDPVTSQQVRFQRIAFEQQRFYENQIREVLKQYPGVEVNVHVDIQPTPKRDRVTAAPRRIPTSSTRNSLANFEMPQAGANSAASVDGPQRQSIPAIQRVTHEADVPGPDHSVNQISVSIDVPQALVHELFGSPDSSSSLTQNQDDLRAAIAHDTEAKFAQLQSEIIQKIRPVLPASTFQNRAEFPIAVNLIRRPPSAANPWAAKIRNIATQNWPSAAVLILGLILLSIVTRKSTAPPSLARAVEPHDNGDVVSIDSKSADPGGTSKDAEVRLTHLIEKDPDAAAKVIESWIRDAA
jgi:hypothetical protein